MESRSVLGAQVRTRSNTPAMCPHHDGKKAVLICLGPGCNTAFACVDCVATNHRGHEMEKLETHATEKKIILKDKMKAVKETLLDSLRQKLETTKNKISSNKTQTKDEQQKIFMRCNAMKEELDKIARKCSELCERTGQENDKKLTEHMECLESIYTKYKFHLDKCEEVIKEGSDSDIVLIERELSVTPDIPPFPDIDVSHFNSGSLTSQKLEDLFGEVISRVHTTNISHALTKSDNSCQPGAHDASALPGVNMEVLSWFELKGDTECICGLLYPLMRKHLYIWFFQSSTVSVVTHDGKVTDTIPLQQSADTGDSGNIEDMCISPVDGTLWFVNTNGRIQQVNQNGKQLELNINKYFVGRKKEPKSVCVTRSQEVVVGVNDKSLVILTTTGKATKKLKSSDIGLHSYATSIVQCQRTGRLAVRDMSIVAVMDEKYNHLYTINGDIVTSADGNCIATGYKCQEKLFPWRMCFDKDGNLLVVDYDNYSVIVFGPSGQYIQTVVKETDNNKCPTIISTTPDRTLWVAYMDDVFTQLKY